MGKKVKIAAVGTIGMIIGILAVVISCVHKSETKLYFGDDEAVRIMGQPVKIETYMLYGVDVKNGYELQYGKGIWNEFTDDSAGHRVTYEIAAKQDIAEQIRMVKVLCKEADAEGIKISESEDQVLVETAKEYYKQLQDAGAADEAFTEDIVIDYYRENYLAQKVYNKFGEEVNNDEEQVVVRISDLLKKYDSEFEYLTNINWALINLLSFREENDYSAFDGISDLKLLQDYEEEKSNDGE